MAVQLYTHEKMLLDLLRASLKQERADATLFESATKEDWLACYKLACAHSVMALAWDGVATLPKELQPFLDLRLSWQVFVSAVERNYQHFSETLVKLSQLYAQHHIRTLVLKGIGFATLYPKPQHREGGDIDIYTYSADCTVLSDDAAHNRANQLMEELYVEVKRTNDKHSVFTYEEVPFENHRTFLDVTEWPFAQEVEKDLHKLLHPVEISIPVGSEDAAESNRILVPTADFNRLFAAVHTLRHYSVGLNLHQLCDWACLIQQEGTQLPTELQDPRYTRVFNLFTSFTSRYFGIAEATSPSTDTATEQHTSTSETDLEDLVYQLFRSPFRTNCRSTNPVAVYLFRIRRFFHYRSALKRLIGEPFWNSTWMLVKARLTPTSPKK